MAKTLLLDYKHRKECCTLLVTARYFVSSDFQFAFTQLLIFMMISLINTHFMRQDKQFIMVKFTQIQSTKLTLICQDRFEMFCVFGNVRNSKIANYDDVS